MENLTESVSTFHQLLQELGYTKSKFAREIGYSAEQVTRWGGSPPEWVMLYLEALKRERCFKQKLRNLLGD